MSADISLREAARLLRDYATPAIAIRDEAGRLTSLITEKDVVRQSVVSAWATSSVSELASPELLIVKSDDYLFHAIAAMRRRGVEYAVVSEQNEDTVGLLSLTAALSGAMPDLLELADRLTHEATSRGLTKVKAAQVELAETLFASGTSATGIQALVSDINNDLHRRVVERAVHDMEAEGWGAPPATFDVIVMGSGGRGESLLFPDQDNGFILHNYAPSRHAAVEAYFVELAERMTGELDSIGFPLCRGGVMATNPLWRKRLDEWSAQIDLWLRRPFGRMLRLADIFFDFRSVHGSGELAGQLRTYLTERVPRHKPFLRAMQTEQKSHGVALRPFRRLQPDTQAGPRRGDLNIKYHVLLPLVETVRLLALEHGISETSTLARLSALSERGLVDDDEHDYLARAFEHATRLMLRQQILDFRANRPASTHVSLEILKKRERRELVDQLNAIRRFKERIDSEFSADLA